MTGMWILTIEQDSGPKDYRFTTRVALEATAADLDRRGRKYRIREDRL